ncbi:excitatory amino acid transporter 1-like [Haliotis rufescens]|uniref:excitatory amino acid transporter 1-like n=1 Tax=Haliotis rufescens TaxID=6454 RepID=UPI00201EC257|nr:excitatory amino acid transporter 1-like [Haliotis rufescens]
MSVVVGGAVGVFCRQLNLSPETIQLIGFPGEIFMRMLKVLILPLIVASMITGIANVDSKSSGRMGLITMGYYIASTVIALMIGVMLVFTIKPGQMTSTVPPVPLDTPAHSPTPGQVLLDLVRFSPIGILCLIAGKILSVQDLTGTVRHLGIYMATGLAGVIIHMFLVVPLMYFIVTRRNPYRVLYGVAQALVTALATESSSATLLVSIRCCEENLKVHKSIARFVLPIGATINMDGSAMINCISAVYVAQLNGISLGLANVLNLCLLNIMASIGIAGVPGSGIPSLLMILNSAGLPTHDIPLLLAVDWFTSRIATVTNVCGDCVATSCVHHLLKPYADDVTLGDRAPAGGSMVHEYETV